MWSEIDYLECVRYIALNSTQEECEKSKLREFLPRRRKRGGARPTVKGAGPRGKVRGDSDQWIFPEVGKLSEEVKREILATVVRTMVKVMWGTHNYHFGGKWFKQRDGGPTGLRGTCAVARLVMSMFDIRWWDLRLKST